MDGDDPGLIADWLMSQAVEHEPAASEAIRAIAAELGVSVARFDSRFKTRDSILEKLERFRMRSAPYYRTSRFNDALRYTVVVGFDGYWERCGAFLAACRAQGLQATHARTEWLEEGYKGLNCTVLGMGAFSFEIQLHTPDSLEASEETHGLYEQERKLERGSSEQLHIRWVQNRRWNRVPVPPGYLEVD